MITFIRRSTRRAYEQAVQSARRVPGLEGELTQQRQQTGELEEKNTGLEQLLQERDGTIEKLHAAGNAIAVLMATAPSPAAAGYHAARVLLAHADQFRLNDTPEGRTGLELLRELTEPRTVTFLYRYRSLKSVHATAAEAHTAAQRQGADPDGWEPAVSYTVRREFSDALDTPWSTATMAVDAATPWTTPREPLASVYVLMSGGFPCAAFSTLDDAIREQDRRGIPRTADSLVRMELAKAPTSAAIPGSSTRSVGQPSAAV